MILDTLAPAERLAFVLHDMFGVSFDEIASIVGRSAAASRQLASRASAEVVGASAVAGTFSGRARAARPALINGAPGAVWAPGGRPRVVFGFTTMHGKIISIEMLADPVRLSELDLVFADE